MLRSYLHRLVPLLTCLGLVAGCWLLGSQPAWAQRPKPTQPVAVPQPIDSLFDFNQDISLQLLPFEELYKIAVAYSPVVHFEQELATAQHAAGRLTKMQVLQNASAFANYSTGNQAIFSTGGPNFGGDLLGQVSNGYRVGVNVQLSLLDIFGRPAQVRLAKANEQAAVQRRRIAEQQLRHDLIDLYQDLLVSQRVLRVRLQDEQASLAAYRVAEVESQTGKASPETLAYNSSRYTQSKATAEQSKGEFLKNIYFLETMVGVPIHQLKRN